MNDSLLICFINALVTLAGVFGGILTANKLTIYRIEQLEKKVEKHNNTIERTFILEEKVETIEEDIKEIKKEIHG